MVAGRKCGFDRDPSHNPPTGSITPTDIRPLEKGDTPSVAALCQRILLRSKVLDSAALASHLEEVFLKHPWYDPEIPSRVFLDDSGEISGFIGVLPGRMKFRNQAIRAAIAGSLVVADPARHPLAGARLLRSVRGGAQDLTLSETANDVSMGMWERMGDRALSQYSLQWLRIFRPSGFAVAALSDRVRLARTLHPIAAVLDSAAQRLRRRSDDGREKVAKFRLQAAARSELSIAIRELSADYPVRPDWDEATLQWLLDHAAVKRRHGEMQSHLVLSPSGKLLGCHIYFARTRGVAWVLQVLARRNSANTVVASLLDHARQSGCSAIRGRTQPETMTPLMRQGALFFCNSATVIHTDNSELRAAIDSGDALITGLAGESWVRMIGDTFARR